VCQIVAAFAVLLVGWVFYQFIEWPLLRKLQARLSSAR
jgi:peptidoglycan/LPS O-acetylase OafA/YrhL